MPSLRTHITSSGEEERCLHSPPRQKAAPWGDGESERGPGNWVHTPAGIHADGVRVNLKTLLIERRWQKMTGRHFWRQVTKYRNLPWTLSHALRHQLPLACSGRQHGKKQEGPRPVWLSG